MEGDSRKPDGICGTLLVFVDRRSTREWIDRYGDIAATTMHAPGKLNREIKVIERRKLDGWP